MRGSPLLRTGLVLLALLLLLPAVRSLTNHRPAPPMPATAAPVAAQPVRLTVTSTVFPFHFAIFHLGRIIWEDQSNAASSAKAVTLRFPPQGIDLLVQASWPEKKEGAVRVEVVPPGRAPITQTLWGTGSVDDVLTFVPAR
ncbi:MAG TPA: hypothetical protein VHW03_01875 [Chthoniobacterales bacterium]|jgi:hypothetical protein|nr:hypothetical protein [Chthoniobacterales bacterium]